MKRITLLLVFIYVCSIAYPQAEKYVVSKTLKNGDVFSDFKCYDGDIIFSETYSKKISSNPIMQTMGINEKIPKYSYKFEPFIPSQKIRETIRENRENLYSSVRIDFGMLPHYEIFRKFIKNKLARDFLAKTFGDMVVELCRWYPKDFKTKCLTTLEYCLEFIDNIPKHKYEIYLNELFVDGTGYDGRGIEGFIIRRIINDNIPKEEMKQYFENLYQRIQSVDVSNNAEVLYSVDINKELKYCLSATGYYFLINGRKISLYDSEIQDYLKRFHYLDYVPSWDYDLKNVKYIYNENNSYYIITTQSKKILIDKQGEILYEE